MHALVFWLQDEQFSVVDANDVILDETNSMCVKEGNTYPVKWRERRGRKIEELVFDAQIKSISENNEELELMCAKLAEEMAEKSAIVGQKKGRKRKRTEKGRDWDKEIGEETAQSGKQPPDIQSTTGSDSGKDDIQTSKSPKKYPPQKRKKITKTGEKQQKKPQEKQMQKTAECIAGKKQEKQKENQTQKTAEIVAEKKQKKPAKEKQVQKAAEIVARKTLATDFFSNVLNSSDRNAEKQKADAAQILIDDYDKEETDRRMAEKYDLTETESNSSQVQTAKRCEDRYICVQPVKSTTVHTPVTRPPLSTPLNTPVARPPVFTPSNNPQPHQLTPTVISVQTPVMQNGNTPVTPAVGNPVRTHEPAKTPLTPNNSVNAEPRIIDPATTSHRQQECGDFGGLFTTSLRLAYGDEPVNYSYLDDLHSEGEPRPLAAAESSACANCEVLMKEIEFLKQNQMPDMSLSAKQFLQQLLSGGMACNNTDEEPSEDFSRAMHSKNLQTTNHFLPGPGKQELYEGSGIFISKVEIQNIHIAAGKKPSEILNKLLGYFFDLRTLASQPKNLDDRIVNACIAYAKRCAAVWKIPERIDFHKTIRNKRGSARRKLERQLAKENVL